MKKTKAVTVCASLRLMKNDREVVDCVMMRDGAKEKAVASRLVTGTPRLIRPLQRLGILKD